MRGPVEGVSARVGGVRRAEEFTAKREDDSARPPIQGAID